MTANPNPAPSPRPAVPAEVFRAYDIRGITPDPLSPELVRAVGRTLAREAREAGETRVAVGRDGRLTGPALQAALVEGLRAGGVSVVDVGQVPTPLLYFAARGVGSGVMVTGSHNPPDYNGLKMLLAGEPLFGERIRRLRERIVAEGAMSAPRAADGGGGAAEGARARAVEGVVEGAAEGAAAPPAADSATTTLVHQDPTDDYVRDVVGRIAPGRSLRVVVDAGNGVAGALAPRLLRALGHHVVELHCEVDGRFPNHPPDTAVAENYRDLIAAVAREEADLGLAFDGDGDRLGVVDGAGRIVWPDRFMMLYAREILARLPGAAVVYDIKCTRHLGEFIEAHGGRPVMWRTGHSYIKSKLKESGAALAGEMSGHVFFADRWYGFDDGLYAAARLLEILAASDETPTAQLEALPQGISTPELRVDMEEGEPERFMERLGGVLPEAPGFAGARIDTMDGMRVELADGWVLVRASNTTPSLSLRLEADSQAALERMAADVRAVFARLDPDLRLPL